MNLREYLAKWKTDRKSESRQIYTKIRNKITSMIRLEKSRYLNKKFDSELSQVQFWKLVKQLGCNGKTINQTCNFSATEFSKEFCKHVHTPMKINNVVLDCKISWCWA